jgi:hypothetical protein
MTIHQGRRPLLIRNPVHSARIAMLHSIWPDAKFIHIHRNPFDVHASAVRMFATLLSELSVQDRPIDTNDLVLETYPRLMTALLEDAGADRPCLPLPRLNSSARTDRVRQRGVNLGRSEVAIDQAALGGICAGSASGVGVGVISSAMPSSCM